MKKNVVIIKQNQDLISTGIREKGYTVFPAYKNVPYFLTLLRRIWFKLGLPGSSVWFNGRLVNLETETIVIYESMIHPLFLKWIRKKNSNTRIIFFYFNIVRTSIHPDLIPDSIEKWSWDKADCHKYHLKYNAGSGYIATPMIQRENKKYDIIFIGRDKGRYTDLMNLQKKLNKYNLSTFFYIVPTKKYLIKHKYTDYKILSYKEMLEKEMQAKVILDFVQEGQTGTTYRTMESIFYSIKLITNNKYIKEYSFYRKENIFILGEDKIENIYEFVNSKYLPLKKEIIDYYSFEYWLERFLIKSDENK